MWTLIVLSIVPAGILVWRLLYLVEWRRSEPGRHSFKYFETSCDEVEPETDVLPIIRAYPTEQHDPTLERLAYVVRRWVELQPNSGHS